MTARDSEGRAAGRYRARRGRAVSPGNLRRVIADGLGADLVIDAAGVSATLKTALEMVRPGGQITKVGWGPQPLDFSLDPLVQKAVRLQGSFSHTFENWEKVVPMLTARQINLGPIITEVTTLDHWKDCFDGMYTGKYVKAVLCPN